jgi:hypothetical protein
MPRAEHGTDQTQGGSPGTGTMETTQSYAKGPFQVAGKGEGVG